MKTCVRLSVVILLATFTVVTEQSPVLTASEFPPQNVVEHSQCSCKCGPCERCPSPATPAECPKFPERQAIPTYEQYMSQPEDKCFTAFQCPPPPFCSINFEFGVMRQLYNFALKHGRNKMNETPWSYIDWTGSDTNPNLFLHKYGNYIVDRVLHDVTWQDKVRGL